MALEPTSTAATRKGLASGWRWRPRLVLLRTVSPAPLLRRSDVTAPDGPQYNADSFRFRKMPSGRAPLCLMALWYTLAGQERALFHTCGNTCEKHAV